MTPRTSVPLLSVIGPINPVQLQRFVQHYRGRVGVERFYFALNVPADTSDTRVGDLIDSLEKLDCDLVELRRGSWHWDTNEELLSRLRAEAGPGWHMIADSDEYHVYPDKTPDALIEEADEAGTPVVEGVLLDRVGPNGNLPTLTEIESNGGDLDASFPLGGFFTHYILGGEPTKVVLAHSDFTLAPGNHEVKGWRGVNRPLVVVHHFKWPAGVVPYLRQRVAHFEAGAWNMGPDNWVPKEARRAQLHLSRHGGFDVAMLHPDNDLLFLPANLRERPPHWNRRSLIVYEVWKNWPKGARPEDVIPTLEAPEPLRGQPRKAASRPDDRPPKRRRR